MIVGLEFVFTGLLMLCLVQDMIGLFSEFARMIYIVPYFLILHNAIFNLFLGREESVLEFIGLNNKKWVLTYLVILTFAILFAIYGKTDDMNSNLQTMSIQVIVAGINYILIVLMSSSYAFNGSRRLKLMILGCVNLIFSVVSYILSPKVSVYDGYTDFIIAFCFAAIIFFYYSTKKRFDFVGEWLNRVE